MKRYIVLLVFLLFHTACTGAQPAAPATELIVVSTETTAPPATDEPTAATIAPTDTPLPTATFTTEPTATEILPFEFPSASRKESGLMPYDRYWVRGADPIRVEIVSTDELVWAGEPFVDRVVNIVWEVDGHEFITLAGVGFGSDEEVTTLLPPVYDGDTLVRIQNIDMIRQFVIDNDNVEIAVVADEADSPVSSPYVDNFFNTLKIGLPRTLPIRLQMIDLMYPDLLRTLPEDQKPGSFGELVVWLEGVTDMGLMMDAISINGASQDPRP